MPGPIPNDSLDLAQPRKADRGYISEGTALPFEWPEPDPDWHPEATALYEGARNSGQRDFYQASDVAMLRFLLSEVTYHRKALRPSGQHLTAILSGLSSLMLTVGERRRGRVELRDNSTPIDREIESLLSNFEDDAS